MISRRVTHLEPSHRADKPLLCLGHLEGRSGSLPSTYESILSRMVTDISHNSPIGSVEEVWLQSGDDSDEHVSQCTERSGGDPN